MFKRNCHAITELSKKLIFLVDIAIKREESDAVEGGKMQFLTFVKLAIFFLSKMIFNFVTIC
jgi:hypothetical protein